MDRPRQIGLQRAAERANADPFFLGHWLALIAPDQTRRGDLAQQLKCELHQLTRLSLCRCPREDSEGFRPDVERIAAFVGCDAVALAQVVRQAQTLRALSSPGGGSSNRLLAARDRLPGQDASDPRGGDK